MKHPPLSASSWSRALAVFALICGGVAGCAASGTVHSDTGAGPADDAVAASNQLAGGDSSSQGSPDSDSDADAGTSVNDTDAGATPGPDSNLAPAEVTIESYFSLPKRGVIFPSPDGSLDAKLIELLSLAVAGSQVRATLYKFSNPLMVLPFTQAHDRGVDLKVVLDDTARKSPYRSVANQLEQDLGAQNVHLCTSGACIGTSNNHNKLYLFSEITDPADRSRTLRHVVVQTSANLNLGQHFNFNDMLVIAGDRTLYQAYLQYWEDLNAENRNTDYMAGPNGVVEAEPGTNARVHFFPSETADPVLEHLQDASCEGGGTIRVAQSDFKNERTARLLSELIALKDKRGCDVALVLRDDSDNDYMDELEDSNLDVGFFSTLQDLGLSVHSKYVLLDAHLTVDGVRARRKVVLTGSSNFSNSGLENDETIIRLESAAVHATYTDNWNAIKQAADAR